MKNIVVIQNLNHYYPEGKERRQVLSNINLTIKPGKIVFLTGESGSGKTTLISLIGCLRSVQEGSLKILGEELCGANEDQLTKLRCHLGYVFQHFNLFDFMTIRQNVQVSLELQENCEPHKAIFQSEALLHEVGLGQRANAYPRELSGGEKQRVAIARALVHRPKLVLADEPTAALDSKTGREVLEVIHDLAKQQGSAVLIVTHNLRILDLADEILKIEDGQLDLACAEQLSLVLPTLTYKQLNEIGNNIELRTYQPGSTIINQGDSALNFFILLEGMVDIIQDNTGEESVFLGRLGKGDFFGQIPLLRGSQHLANICVNSDSEAKVLVMNRKTFLKMIHDSPMTSAIIKYQTLKPLSKVYISKKIIP